jgi:nitrogen regulatory protein P-II 1
MKLVVAYIQPERLNSVKQSLFKRDIHKISVTNALGCGQQMGYTEVYPHLLTASKCICNRYLMNIPFE